MTIQNRLKLLRAEMKKRGIAVYLVPTADFHESEYVGAYFKARAFLTGFTGSSGTAVITLREAGLWTDGRYFLQAAEQLNGTGVTLYRMGEEGVPTVTEYLRRTLKKGDVLGYDGRVVNARLGDELRAIVSGKQGSISDGEDLIGLIWKDRPGFPEGKAWHYDERFSGESVSEKLTRVRAVMREQGAQVHVLTSLYDIAWLLNVRGGDIDSVPVVLSYLALENRRCLWFVRKEVVTQELREALAENRVKIRPYEEFYDYIAAIPAGKTVLLDRNTVNSRVCSLIPSEASVLDLPNPTVRMRAVKNETELACTRRAHLRDAAVMCRFLCWLKSTVGKEPLTEISVSDRLRAFAEEEENFLELSFGTICGYGAHGAIIHYGATPESNIPVLPEGLLLIDSGRHYLDGSTDITRTVAMGPLTDDMKKDFARVLRANLRLMNARFLYGCTGLNLDILAREPFWESGLDYKHGTGHGIGHVLNVHEGPNGFRWRRSPDRSEDSILEEGMITSDEPGIYREGAYGIRLENEILCRSGEKNEYGQFMYFENLTFVPFDREAIDPALLDASELRMLNDYHREVYEAVSPLLDKKTRAWLKDATAPL